MGKALIIAEKPSVANDISRALGGFTKKGDFFESDAFVLSSAIGHLLEICPPTDFEVKRGKWSFAHLPVIPPHFDLQPLEKTEARLKLLAKLIRRPDVDVVVNACDAGREGELIFRYILRHTRADKTVRRLWLQSMTADAIREGFKALREDAALQPLAAAAVCRSEADWLVGINGTRAMTAFNSRAGGFQLTTVGRVQTPTLAIVVEREDRIRKFVPRDYWELHATFAAAQGRYEGRWFDETFSKEKGKESDAELKPERIWNREKAEAIAAKCLSKRGVVTEESKSTTQLSPLLYDLTSLQREANGRFGYSASSTLKIAQALYERHKVLTYPRTDSRALPEDYPDPVKGVLRHLADSIYGGHAQTILTNGWVRPNKRIFNNAKISDHFAIIPTAVSPKHLHEDETKIYDMVTRRFLAVFFPAAEYLVTTRITRVESEAFKTEGKVLVNPGWLAVYGKEGQGDEQPNLVAVSPNEPVLTEHIEVAANQTTPPPRYSEATLLSAMEGAGKWVEDEELREAMSAKGLGTPATRAAVIEGLLHERYLVRHNRELHPTAKGISLIALLRGLSIPELCSPELTGDWEFKLKQIEHGQLKREAFMAEIADMTRHIVDQARRHESDTVPGDFGELKNRCPKCGGLVKETYRNFQCQGCDFFLPKILASRQFEIPEAEDLVIQKTLGPLTGFRSRQGRPFSAIVRLGKEFKLEFDFGQGESGAQGEQAAVDFTGQESLGKCPKCKEPVYEHGMSYVCSKSVGSARTCDFRSGKVILQRPIDRPQMSKLLETGKTELLRRFISKKGRPFSAYLVVDAKGNVGFEFEPRAPKKAKQSETPAAKAPPTDPNSASEA